MNHLATAYLFGHDHIVVLGAVDRLSARLRAAVIEHCVIVVHHVCVGWVSCGCSWRRFPISALQPGWLRLLWCPCVCGWLVGVCECVWGVTRHALCRYQPQTTKTTVCTAPTHTHKHAHIHEVFSWIFVVYVARQQIRLYVVFILYYFAFGLLISDSIALSACPLCVSLICVFRSGYVWPSPSFPLHLRRIFD